MSIMGHITKLIVNIDKCQTRITYADGSTRMLCANPSGFSFHEVDYRPPPSHTPLPSIKNERSPATAFLERHFDSENNFLLPHNYDHRNENDMRCYTEETVEWPEPQTAKIIEWPWPKEESLQIFNRFWHLDNCFCREFAITNEFQQPKCHCLQIKETMDHINELVSPEENAKLENGDTLLSTDLNIKMMSVNGYLKELNELLELQDKLNKRLARKQKKRLSKENILKL